MYKAAKQTLHRTNNNYCLSTGSIRSSVLHTSSQNWIQTPKRAVQPSSISLFHTRRLTNNKAASPPSNTLLISSKASQAVVLKRIHTSAKLLSHSQQQPQQPVPEQSPREQSTQEMDKKHTQVSVHTTTCNKPTCTNLCTFRVNVAILDIVLHGGGISLLFVWYLASLEAQPCMYLHVVIWCTRVSDIFSGMLCDL
jgi:hypothetical protein